MTHERMIHKSFGGFLRTQRNYRGLTVWMLARRARLTGQRIMALEHGRPLISVRKNECEAIASVLEIPVQELLDVAAGKTIPSICLTTDRAG